MSKTQAPDPAPRPFTAVKAFADSVLAMLDERIKAVDQAAHPFNDYFGDQPETIVAAKAQAGELREVRTQVRILGDRALVELMKFKPAIPAPEGAQALTNDQLWASWLCCPPAAEGDDDSMEARVVKFGRAVEQRVRAALAAPAPKDSLDSAQPSKGVAMQAPQAPEGAKYVMCQALEALENSVDLVANDYHDDWRHGIPSRAAQLAGIKAQVEAHKAAIVALRAALGIPAPQTKEPKA